MTTKLVYSIFLDDERYPSDSSSINNIHICRTAEDAQYLIERYGWPKYISFDHDLGMTHDGKLRRNGYDFATWIVNRLAIDQTNIPFEWTIHSMNPIGAVKIAELFQAYSRFVFSVVKPT